VSKATKKLLEQLYTPPHRAEEDDPPKYRIRPLDSMEALELSPEVEMKDGSMVYTGKGLVIAVKYGLVGGEDNDYSQADKRKLPPFDLNVIAGEIINITNWSGDDAKNS